MNRGDIVICAIPGDYGKPRPAVVVQSDFFNDTHTSLVVCPITSEIMEAPLFRVLLRPAPGNGLRKESHVMIDKMAAVRRDRIRKRAGKLSSPEMAEIDSVLRLWLDLA